MECQKIKGSQAQNWCLPTLDNVCWCLKVFELLTYSINQRSCLPCTSIIVCLCIIPYSSNWLRTPVITLLQLISVSCYSRQRWHIWCCLLFLVLTDWSDFLLQLWIFCVKYKLFLKFLLKLCIQNFVWDRFFSVLLSISY